MLYEGTKTAAEMDDAIEMAIKNTDDADDLQRLVDMARGGFFILHLVWELLYTPLMTPRERSHTGAS